MQQFHIQPPSPEYKIQQIFLSIFKAHATLCGVSLPHPGIPNALFILYPHSLVGRAGKEGLKNKQQFDIRSKRVFVSEHFVHGPNAFFSFFLYTKSISDSRVGTSSTGKP